MTAYLALKRPGEPAAPYLVEGLSAGDDAVGALAARLLDEMATARRSRRGAREATEGDRFAESAAVTSRAGRHETKKKKEAPAP